MYLKDSSSKRVIKKSHELNQERKRTDIITDATHKKEKDSKRLLRTITHQQTK